MLFRGLEKCCLEVIRLKIYLKIIVRKRPEPPQMYIFLRCRKLKTIRIKVLANMSLFSCKFFSSFDIFHYLVASTCRHIFISLSSTDKSPSVAANPLNTYLFPKSTYLLYKQSFPSLEQAWIQRNPTSLIRIIYISLLIKHSASPRSKVN